MTIKNFFNKPPTFNPDVTQGVCPSCTLPTMLVSLTKDFYRCITCGADLEQKRNGVIKYIPTISKIAVDKSPVTNVQKT
jgi:uncharacterized protein (DUF983 family)|tara:strand:+ start:820 stop:1056 length:237 start_codon:yes stop_codon:yes gene_type:complete